jgi:hypothetical protein
MVSTRIECLVVVLVCVACAPSGASPAESPPHRSMLRPMDAQMRGLVQAGRAQSPSFSALVDRLAAADVVVYVKCAWLRSRIDGELTFLSAAGGLRYVMVRVAPHLTTQRKIAILGHELQHALEIAERPAIVDSATLARAYEQFGFTRRAGSRVDFDTAAAIDTGHTIWRVVTLRSDGD